MSNIIYCYCLEFELNFKSTFCAKRFDQIIGRVYRKDEILEKFIIIIFL